MPVMLLKMPAQHAYQTIALKLANLAFIRDFVSKHNVDCDLDCGVDGCSYYATEADFKAAIGWWHNVPRALLRPFGIHIMEGEAEMREQINLKQRTEGGGGGGGAPNGAWGCIRLVRDYDTICAARFVIAAVDQAIAMGAEVFTHTLVEQVTPALEGPEEDEDGGGGGGGGGWLVKCVDGKGKGCSSSVVRCKKVIYATNAYTAKLCPVLAEKIRPVRNHVLVTSPAPSILKDGSRSGSGSNNGFNYWIQREDGRIVLGGFRDREP
jgi:glycine/D-amino acid oxidase-like deaminating enzyme